MSITTSSQIKTHTTWISNASHTTPAVAHESQSQLYSTVLQQNSCARRSYDSVTSQSPAGAGPKNRGSFPAIVPLNNPWELRGCGVTHQATVTAAPPAAGHTLCAATAAHCCDSLHCVKSITRACARARTRATIETVATVCDSERPF